MQYKVNLVFKQYTRNNLDYYWIIIDLIAVFFISPQLNNLAKIIIRISLNKKQNSLLKKIFIKCCRITT